MVQRDIMSPTTSPATMMIAPSRVKNGCSVSSVGGYIAPHIGDPENNTYDPFAPFACPGFHKTGGHKPLNISNISQTI